MALRPSALPAFGVFAVAARHENFARAAQELSLTASAVSHHVRRLESSLGVKLFQRHARGVALTMEGRSLADAATAAFSDIDAVAVTLNGAQRNMSRVSVAALHSLTYCWLLPRLPGFVAQHPGIRVSFETGLSLARFDDNGPDLAIRFGPGHWPGVTAHYLMDEHLFPVAAPTLAGVSGIIEAADIARLPLISDLAFQGWREWFSAAGVRDARLPPMHSFTDTTDALRAAAVGLGAALGRTRVAAPYFARGELIRLPGPLLKAGFSYYAIHPTHKRPAPAALKFLEWLQLEAAQATNGPPLLKLR